MNYELQYDSNTHHHDIQLGNLENLCDDVIGVVADFLSNSDVYNMAQLSNSYLFKILLYRRYFDFNKKRREKLENIYSMRDNNYQFASKLFKWGRCVISDCGNTRARLDYFTDHVYRIPYCSNCWEFKILPKYS